MQNSPELSLKNVFVQDAHWISSNTGIAILSRDWKSTRKMPPLKLRSGTRIREILKVTPFTASFVSGYFLDGGNVVFVLAPPNFLSSFIAPDAEIFVAGNFNGWKNAIGNALWKLQKTNFHSFQVWALSVPRNFVFGNDKNHVSFKFVSKDEKWFDPPPDAYNLVLDEFGNGKLHATTFQSGAHVFKFISETPINFDAPDELIFERENSVEQTFPIRAGHLMSRIFSREKLGATINDSGTQTTFRLFAPRATNVFVEFWNPRRGNDVSRKRAELSPIENGIWEFSANGNLAGFHYNFFVAGENSDNSTAFDESTPILDPYAKAAVSRSGPGIVIDEKKFKKPRSRWRPPHVADLVIVEVHLRDLIAKIPHFENDKKLGFRELAEWLRSDDCYLKQLGANAVELQPIQEFDAENPEDYHWGYMTTNWFSPASHYASNPAAGTQLSEFRELVDAFHDAGFAVILDVVYNHVGEPNHLFRIDKEYYFNITQHGDFVNWSGCGNDYNANFPMARRLVIESLLWQIEAFGVDGFRFDLAELVGVPALTAIEKSLRSRFPDVILIAEPWSFRGHIAQILRKTSYSSWNDGFRDYAAKYVHNCVNLDGFRYFLAGSPEYFSAFPSQTINYTESHDDRCWLDKITECGNSNAEKPTPRDRRRTHIMLAFLLSSLGTPMLAAGQDFLRTKHGKNNTYLDGEENALDYARLRRFQTTHEFARRWIRFRLSPNGRLLRQRKSVPEDFFRFFPDQKNSAVAAIFNASETFGKLQYALLLNPQTEAATIQIQKNVLEGFRQIANSTKFDFNGVPKEKGFCHENGFLTLPPLSVAFFIKGEDF